MGIQEAMEISAKQDCSTQSYPAKKFSRFKWFFTEVV